MGAVLAACQQRTANGEHGGIEDGEVEDPPADVGGPSKEQTRQRRCERQRVEVGRPLFARRAEPWS